MVSKKKQNGRGLGEGKILPCPLPDQEALSKIIKMKYTKIGGAWNSVSKTSGKKYISVRFDEGVFERLTKEDFEKKIAFYPATKLNEKSPDFSVSAPMPDDYQSKFIKNIKANEN